jgi:oxygen-independent coproporphyrinogen III oxidase
VKTSSFTGALLIDNLSCSDINNSIANSRLVFERNPLDFEIIYNYPPANHTPIVLANNLPNFSKGKPTGIYIHIPFCTKTCSYCHYTRKDLESINEIDEYVSALKLEMENWHHTIDDQIGKDIKTIFVGGGTPTILTEKQIVTVTDAINNIYEIPNSHKLGEYTWEASPETIIGENIGKLKILLEAGVNRLSLGMQAFDDRLLTICERSHSKSQAIKSFEIARSIGFSNINIDLIYSLPEQSISDWAATIRETINLSPESISIHQLRIKQNTPMYDRLLNDLSRFPTQEICFDMLGLAHDLLDNAGYVAIENDLFVKDLKKHDHRHQKNKWVRFEDILGIGAGAYGYLDEITYFNYLTRKQYYDAIKRGQLPVWRAKTLTLREQKARMMILGLTFYEGVSKELYRIKFRENVEDNYCKLLDRLKDDGLIEVTDKQIRLTKKGGFFSPEIRKEFYLKEHQDGPGPFGSYFPNFGFFDKHSLQEGN